MNRYFRSYSTLIYSNNAYARTRPRDPTKKFLSPRPPTVKKSHLPPPLFGKVVRRKKRAPSTAPSPFPLLPPVLVGWCAVPVLPLLPTRLVGWSSIFYKWNIPQVGGGCHYRKQEGRGLGQGVGVFRPFSVRFWYALAIAMWGVCSQMGLFWLTRGQGGAFGCFSGDLSTAGVSGLVGQNTRSSGQKKNPAQGARGYLVQSLRFILLHCLLSYIFCGRVFQVLFLTVRVLRKPQSLSTCASRRGNYGFPRYWVLRWFLFVPKNTYLPPFQYLIVK